MLSRLVVDDGVRVFSCVCALFDSSSGMDFAHSMRLLAVLCKVVFSFVSGSVFLPRFRRVLVSGTVFSVCSATSQFDVTSSFFEFH